MGVEPIRALELRADVIPRSALIKAIERETGRSYTHEHRYYLENQPVHCGDELELYKDGQWMRGRYEWTGNVDDVPTIHLSNGLIGADGHCLLRWPRTR